MIIPIIPPCACGLAWKAARGSGPPPAAPGSPAGGSRHPAGSTAGRCRRPICLRDFLFQALPEAELLGGPPFALGYFATSVSLWTRCWATDANLLVEKRAVSCSVLRGNGGDRHRGGSGAATSLLFRRQGCCLSDGRRVRSTGPLLHAALLRQGKGTCKRLESGARQSVLKRAPLVK